MGNGGDLGGDRGATNWSGMQFFFSRCTALTLAADHVYLICEPPGEPYYLARIMEWMHSKNDPNLPVDQIRINWFYRPKDVGRKAQDTRMVLATMHSDLCPLTSLRGKCQVKHKADIPDMSAYKRTPDCFWYEKLYDRFLMKNYDVIPSSQIVNVPERVKRVLDERWKFILVEQGRGKELTSAVKLCKRCSGYCARYVPFFFLLALTNSPPLLPIHRLPEDPICQRFFKVHGTSPPPFPSCPR